MNKPDYTEWRRTSPLAAIFYVGKFFEAVAKNAVQSLAPLVAFVLAAEGPILTRLSWGGSLFLAVVAVTSLLRYWFFRYTMTKDSILIREGVLRRKQLDIKFDRIQAISTEQNVIYRALDLVTVKFDTAGSAGQEGYLPAVKAELARSIKQRIRRRPGPGAEAAEEPGEDSIPVLVLDWTDMLRIGLSSNRALIFLVLLGPVIEQAESRIEQALADRGLDEVIEGAAAVTNVSVLLASAVIVAFLLLLALASVIGAFLRYHDFTLAWEDDVLRSRGGLLTRHEQSVNRNKIQSLEAKQNPLLLLFRRFRLRATQASSGKPGSEGHFLVPLCDADNLESLSADVFQEEFTAARLDPAAPAFRPIARRYIRSRVMLTGVFPAVLATAAATVLAGAPGLVLLAWIPVNALIIIALYRRHGFVLGDDGMVIRRGLLGFHTSAFLHRKVQRISLTQSPSQRRHGLATVRFYLASGSLRLPYVDIQLARKLRDHVLFRIESSRLAWH